MATMRHAGAPRRGSTKARLLLAYATAPLDTFTDEDAAERSGLIREVSREVYSARCAELRRGGFTRVTDSSVVLTSRCTGLGLTTAAGLRR